MRLKYSSNKFTYIRISKANALSTIAAKFNFPLEVSFVQNFIVQKEWRHNSIHTSHPAIEQISFRSHMYCIILNVNARVAWIILGPTSHEDSERQINSAERAARKILPFVKIVTKQGNQEISTEETEPDIEEQ